MVRSDTAQRSRAPQLEPDRAHQITALPHDENAVPRLPAFDLAADEAVLERQRRALRQECVDAARVGLEHRARFARQTGEVALRRARDIEPPRQRIRRDTRAALPFRPAAQHAPARGIHLPKPILSMDIALREKGIPRSARADMRNAPGITMDVDVGLETVQRDDAFGLRQA